MSTRPFALFLAVLVAWMGFTAQQQASAACSEDLAEQMLARSATPALSAASSERSLDAHHLDDLPVQLLADLLGLLGLLGASERLAAPGAPVRPAAPWPVAWPAPDLDGLHRPPIAQPVRV